MRAAKKNKKLLHEIYSLLDHHYGNLHWWPGETPFEVIVGAILTQNTNWDNAAKAIGNLKAAGMLCPRKLYAAELEYIAELIRPSGYFNIKARRLMSFLHFLHCEFGGDIDKMFCLDTGQLRQQLLSVNGIGEETADSILLYAGEKRVFVVDAYTKRILHRHGIISEVPSYGEVQSLFESCLSPEIKIYNQYHALIVQAGKDYCRKKPLCDDCPLRHLDHV